MGRTQRTEGSSQKTPWVWEEADQGRKLDGDCRGEVGGSNW